MPIELNGLKFDVDILGGHKTGLYLDQQQNYQKVADLIRGGQVLDCFSFLGGFALHCARAGAAHVHGLDQSEDAVAAAEQNAKANGLTGQMQFRNHQRLRLAQGPNGRQSARKSRSEIRCHYT